MDQISGKNKRTTMRNNPDPISIEAWETKYKPVMTQDADPHPVEYETFESEKLEHDYTALFEAAAEFTGGDKDKAFLHIWTEVASDDGEEFLLVNGIRRINRLQYFVCEVPFADTIAEGLDLLQEVHEEIIT
jgi:hypothetical protein